MQRKQHECSTSKMIATQTTRVQHKYNTSARCTTRVQDECYRNNTSVTWVNNFDFDNDTSNNIFSHPYIYYTASERLQGEVQLHSKNYFFEISHFHAKMQNCYWQITKYHLITKYHWICYWQITFCKYYAILLNQMSDVREFLFNFAKILQAHHFVVGGPKNF